MRNKPPLSLQRLRRITLNPHCLLDFMHARHTLHIAPLAQRHRSLQCFHFGQQLKQLCLSPQQRGAVRVPLGGQRYDDRRNGLRNCRPQVSPAIDLYHCDGPPHSVPTRRRQNAGQVEHAAVVLLAGKFEIALRLFQALKLSRQRVRLRLHHGHLRALLLLNLRTLWSRRLCQRCVWCAEPSGAARIRAAKRAYFADYHQRWPDYPPVGRAEWNHRMVNNMKRRKQKAPTRPSPPLALRLTRPRKRSAAMKRSGEWRSSMLTARSFAKL